MATVDIHDSKLENMEEEKKEVIPHRIQKKSDDRVAELKRKCQEREKRSDSPEQLAYFLNTFTQLQKEIDSNICNAENTDKTKLPSYFDSVSQKMQKLQKFLADYTMFLPSYEIERAQRMIEALHQKSQKEEETLLPKKKFGFKSKKIKQESKNIDGKGKKVIKDSDTCHPKKVNETPKDLNADCGFSSKTGETLSLSPEHILQKNVSISFLEDCIVKLFGAPSTLHITSLKNCKILTGPISTSVFVEDCQHCTFVIACQQLRTHTTANSNFYVHITSRAIIEDCHAVHFAPYNLKYQGIEEHFQLAGLDIEKNNWQSIDDFNWLASDKASPNWGILDESEIIKSWD